MREIEPKLRDLSDGQVAEIRDLIYELAQLAYDSYKEQNDSKFPVGSVELDDRK